MKIHFCDLCNESVPQGDLDIGRAFLRKGRVVCANCDRAMSHAHVGEPVRADGAGGVAGNPTPSDPAGAGGPSAATAAASPPLESAPAISPASALGTPPSPTHHVATTSARSSGSGAILLAALALVFAVGATYVLDGRIHDLDAKNDASAKVLDKSGGAISALERRAAQSDEAQRDLEKRMGQRIDAQKPRYAAIDEDLAKLSRAHDELVAHLAELGKTVSDVREKQGTPSVDLEKRLADLSTRIAKGEDDSRALREELAALSAVVAAQPAPVTVDAAKPAEAAWKSTLPDLASADESARWEAVTTLGATNDPAVVPHIVPMLKDKNVFVRMAAARMLGNLQAKPAVGALIDALEDVEEAVREAAFVALRVVTSKDFKFESHANEGERAKRIKVWRDWWKKESESPSSG